MTRSTKLADPNRRDNRKPMSCGIHRMLTLQPTASRLKDHPTMSIRPQIGLAVLPRNHWPLCVGMRTLDIDEGAQKDSFEVDWHDSFLLMGFAF
jgi:hypothetical protein